MYNKDRLISTFTELCKRDSESLDERHAAEYVKKYLAERNIEVHEDTVAEKIGGNTGNLIFELPGKKPGKILFSAHIDTVAPGKGVNPVITETRISSDGTTILGADDKAGVAIILEGIATIIENQIETPTLVVVLSVAEEIGLKGVIHMGETIIADCGYVLDSSSVPGTIVNQAPVHYKYEATVIGKAAHAGLEPEKGINAIKIAAEAITKIPSGRIDEGTTTNIGKISGGIATNIVTEEVIINGEIRSFDTQKAERMLKEIKNTFEETASSLNGSVTFEDNKAYDHFIVDEQQECIQKAKKVISSLGRTPTVISAGGGSDANIFNQKNIPSVILGLGYENVHTKQEYIEKENLYASMEIVLGLMRDI